MTERTPREEFGSPPRIDKRAEKSDDAWAQFGAGARTGDATAPRPPRLRRARGTPRQRAIRGAGLVLILIAGSWGVILGGRQLAGHLAMLLPYSTDQRIGELAQAQLLEGQERCDNPRLVRAVEDIVAHLGSGVDPEYADLQVVVLKDKRVNAFALPGGYIFVLTGLLGRIKSPDELVGVLGHEIGHVVYRHGLQRIAEGVWFRLVLAQVVGDFGGIADAMAGQAIGLLSLKFSRDQERESDRFGISLMRRVGYSADAVPGFFERLEEREIPEWLSTHPSSEGRAEKLRKAIEAAGPPDHRVRPPRLEDLSAPCHLQGPL